MRFRDMRDTLIKGIDTPVGHPSATVRWLSPRASGYGIASLRKVLDEVQMPVARSKPKRLRRRLPGVAIPRAAQPWKA